MNQLSLPSPPSAPCRFLTHYHTLSRPGRQAGLCTLKKKHGRWDGGILPSILSPPPPQTPFEILEPCRQSIYVRVPCGCPPPLLFQAICGVMDEGLPLLLLTLCCPHGALDATAIFCLLPHYLIKCKIGGFLRTSTRTYMPYSGS